MNRAADRILAYNAQVPRYTSYPTAPNFAAADDALYRACLQGVDAAAPVSVYIHVPFCREMCWYCGCNTTATRKYAPVEDYISLLLRELRIFGQETGGRRLRLGHLHFGGGSPSMLSPDDFRRVMDGLRACFDFCADAEIAIEGDPRGITHDRAEAYAACGVNRASLGIQDFSPVVQAAINRMQPAALVARAVDLLRGFGIAGINFDLMYGLPLQTCDDVRATVEKSLALAPQRLAVFGYAHVPWMKKHMRLIRDEDLPDAAERLRQFACAEDLLAGAGMQVVGIDHFVAPDDPMALALRDRTLRRNFQGYTTDRSDTLLGFGASSISRFKGGFAQNATTVTEYAADVLAGKMPVRKTCPVSADDILRGGIISELMCYLDCDVAAHLAQAGMPENAFDDILAGMSDLVADGLASVSGRKITLDLSARQIARVAAARFDAYLPASAKRHAQVA